MFENIIGQDNIVNLLINDINNNSLSNSMIFMGEKYSGRLKTAFELARILNCTKEGNIDCDCLNCKSMVELNFKGLIYLSRRDNNDLLKEYILSFNNFKETKFLDNIIRLIKISTLSLHDFLIKDAFNDQEKKTIYDILERLNNIILKEMITIEDLNETILIFQKLNNIYKTINVPVSVFRSMLDWTYISQPDINRVIIIDHVDQLEKSSQNILLKRLEEPSDNLYFILIAENKNNIVRTILSRCRSYYFKKLNIKDVNIIIKTNFGILDEFESINNFLLRDDDKYLKNIYPVIIKLLNLIFLKEVPFSELTIFIQSINDKKFAKAILFELSRLFIKELSNRQINFNEETDYKILKKISTINLNLLYSMFIEKYNSLEKYNLNPILLLEGLFYPLKAMIKNDKF